MTFLNKKVLTIILGATASHVFGETTDVSASSSDDDECLARDDSPIVGLQEEEVVNCGSLETSLTDIVKYLSSDDDDFGGVVTFAGDGVSAECLDYQYPLQGPQPLTCTLYDKARDQYATPTTSTRPTFIVQAANALDVQATILYATMCGYKVNTRSGGHSYLGISSCDGSEDCIQLDVKMINTIAVSGEEEKQLHVGPGATLEELAVVFAENNVFVPAGECDEIGVGGHLQTGGFGVWGALFGAFSNYVDSFKIVLADGSLQSVTKPKDETTKLNDDLFYSVLGGASGSFGTIVDVTLNTVQEKKNWSFYWEVNFLYNSDTLPGIINMLKKYAELLEGVDVDSTDTKWNIVWSLIGSKAALSKFISDQPGSDSVVGQNLSFSYFQIDLAWTIPKSSANGKKKALAEATAFYNDLVAECTDCVLLDDFIGQFQAPDDNPLKPVGDILAASFPSAYGVEAPISELYKELTVFDWDSYQLNGVPYKSSYQQGPSFPDGDAFEKILTSIDASMPKTGSLNPVDGLNEVYFVIAQFVTVPGPRFVDSSIALPHQNDVFGVAFDMWDLTRTGGLLAPIGLALNAVQTEAVIPALGNVDHRMFWSAYETPDLTTAGSEDVGKYYESEEKYERLVEIKTCVDPDDVFQSRMSLPVSTA